MTSISERLGEVRNGLFFIVGPHRGGTTLLQAMLSSHSAITIPPETGYFDQVWPRRETWGPLSDDRVMSRVGAYLNGPHCSVSDLKLNWDVVSQRLADTKRGYDDLFLVLLMHYADQRGKRRVGEKSPRHLFDAEMKLCLFPQAKFLCLMRDPRAVVRSEMETSWGSRSVGRITKRWLRVAQEVLFLTQQLSPNQFCLVRYENLVQSPESELRRICHFLGEEFEPEMLRFYERGVSEQGFSTQEVWKKKTLQPLDDRRISQWRTELSAGQIALIEASAGHWLERMGYTPANFQISRHHLAITWIQDRVRWAWEIAKGLWRGRSRRRPWSSVWAENFSRSHRKPQ